MPTVYFPTDPAAGYLYDPVQVNKFEHTDGRGLAGKKVGSVPVQ